MAMGKRKTERQQELWIAATDLTQAPGHPFYRKLNHLLGEHGFDPFAEGLCQEFYHDELGRPNVPPGVYFRMLLIGYFEGVDSERGIAWRCGNSRPAQGGFCGRDALQGRGPPGQPTALCRLHAEARGGPDNHWYVPTVRRTAQLSHVLIDTKYWKSFVHSGLDTVASDLGCISLYGTAKTDHSLFAEHVARSERWVEIAGPYGTVRERSWPPTRPDNYWLDCLAGCAVAASMLGVRVPGQDAKPIRQRKRYTQEDLRRR